MKVAEIPPLKWGNLTNQLGNVPKQPQWKRKTWIFCLCF